MYSKRASRFFFFLLAFFFLITAPVIIFYALGYRYSLERGIFIHSGSITIKSNPQSVSIIIDGKPVSERKINFINNYYHIDGIRPGIHEVEVTAEGFSTWKKTTEVHSGISTEFWNVMLTRKSYPPNIFSTGKTVRFFPSPKNDFISLTHQTETSFSVTLFDIDNANEEEFFSSAEYYFTTNKKENIEWTPQENKIIVPVENKNEKNYFVVDINNKKASKLSDLSKINGAYNVRWDSNRKDILYFMKDNQLYQIDTEDPVSLSLAAENISDYDLSGSHIYLFRNDNGIIYRMDNDNFQDLEQITSSPPTDMADPNYRIIVYDEKRIAMLNDKSKKFCIFNEGESGTYLRELAKNIEDIQFSNDGKKILYWSDRELYAYFTRDWKVQPMRMENENLNITRYSHPVRNVQWLKDYEHILFSTGNSFKVIELDHRDRHISMDIVNNIDPEAEIFADFSSDRIYLSQSSNDSNYFQYIEFPEKTGFFGN